MLNDALKNFVLRRPEARQQEKPFLPPDFVYAVFFSQGIA